MYAKYFKRIIDFWLSLIGLVVLSPVFLILILLGAIFMRGNPFFTQERPGKDEKIFKLIKFRTMDNRKDGNGKLLPDEVRLNKYGRFLRSTSLDELPELINIIKGDMAIVGPRPQLVCDMVFMTPEQRKRHSVRQGLTGWAQVNGRNGISWEDKFKYDLEYVESVSLFYDIKILIMTVGAVFKQDGITMEDMATAMDFGDYLLSKGVISQEEYDKKQQEANVLLGNTDDKEKKKVLIVASVISFIEWFNKENVDYLCNELECEVHIACNIDYMEDTDEERTKLFLEKVLNEGVILHNIHFARSPFDTDNISAFRQLKSIINGHKFDLIHCHTPVASILTRIAAKKARKKGSVVMYTCHGFHFHNASPKKNWIIYYPIEKFCSRFCDYIVTINKEDYNRAKKFHAKNVRYIPGVGVDVSHIKEVKIDKEEYKESIGVPRDAIMILSVGELIERKNHEVIIRALGRLQDNNLYYVICGKGPLKKYLEELASSLAVRDNVKLLGFRRDIPELCHAADISAFPSRIEGLGLAGIEALAAGVPLVASNVHGIRDYVIDGETGYAYSPDDLDGFTAGIKTLSNSKELRIKMRDKCIKSVEPYELHNALSVMWNIYKEILM